MSRSSLTLALILLLGLLCPSSAELTPEQEALLDRVRGQASPTIAVAERALVDKELVRGLFRLAEQYLHSPEKAKQLANLAFETSAYAEDIQQATAYEMRGSVLARIGAKLEAVADYTKAETLYQQAGDQAKALGVKADALVLTGEFPSATECLEEALRLSEESDYEARATFNGKLSHLRAAAGDPKRAMDCMRESLRLYEKAGNEKGQGTAAGTLASMVGSSGNAAEAFSLFERSALHFSNSGQTSGEAKANEGMALAALQLGKVDVARQGFVKAHALYTQLGDSASANRTQVMLNQLPKPGGESSSVPQATVMLIQQGYDRFSQGDFQGALEQADSALASTAAREDPRLAAWALQLRAGALQSLGRDREALESLQRAEQELKTVSSTPQVRAGLQDALGRVYSRLGQFEKARSSLQQALQIHQSTGDRLSQAGALQSLGDLERKLGKINEARTSYEKSILLFGQSTPRNFILEGLCMLSLSSLESGSARHTQAIRWAEAAKQLFAALAHQPPFGKLLVLALQQKAQTLRSPGELIAARDCLQEALDVSVRLNDQENEGMLSVQLGSLERESGRYDSAARHLERAEKLVSGLGPKVQLVTEWASLRMSQGDKDGARAGLQEFLSRHGSEVDPETRRILQDYLGILDTDPERALAAAERLFDREGFDQIPGAGAVRATLVAVNQLKQGEDGQALETLQTASQAAESLRLETHSPISRSAVLARYVWLNVLKADLEPDAVKAFAAVESAHGRSLLEMSGRQRGKIEQATLDEVAAIIPRDSVLIEYLVSPDAYLIFAINPQGHASKVRVKRELGEFGGAVREFRESCLGPGQRATPLYEAPVKEFDKKAAQVFYRSLIEPVFETPGFEAKHLIIVPDGPLHDLPFQALYDGESFLLEKYRISYATSGSLLKKAVDRSARPGALGDVLIVADPSFGTLSWSPGGEARSDRLAALAGTRREADSIQRLLPSARILSGESATETKLRQELGRSQILHFATHGLLDAYNPLRSALALAQPAPGAPDDGFLTAEELSQLKLRADLMVMSACETARGQAVAGEGVLGLLWAAQAAGVSSTVVSQWKVDDAATADLMSWFYEGLQTGLAKDEALRTAQLRMLADPKRGHPYYWGAFLLSGDWR